MTHAAAETRTLQLPAVDHESRRRGSAPEIIHTSTPPSLVVPVQAVKR